MNPRWTVRFEVSLKSEQISKIATMLVVPEQDVASMNRRLTAPDHSLNTLVNVDSEGEWQDWLVARRTVRRARLVSARS